MQEELGMKYKKVNGYRKGAWAEEKKHISRAHALWVHCCLGFSLTEHRDSQGLYYVRIDLLTGIFVRLHYLIG
jgi:hypothetical protein